MFADESLRLGTVDLIHKLRNRGWEVWIYTTSNRRPSAVRRWLRLYGVRIDGFVNQDIYNAYLQRAQPHRSPSKNPPAFGIDLQVDDSGGVRIECEQYGFRVVVVTLDDREWVVRVLRAASDLERRDFGD